MTGARDLRSLTEKALDELVGEGCLGQAHQWCGHVDRGIALVRAQMAVERSEALEALERIRGELLFGFRVLSAEKRYARGTLARDAAFVIGSRIDAEIARLAEFRR